MLEQDCTGAWNDLGFRFLYASILILLEPDFMVSMSVVFTTNERGLHLLVFVTETSRSCECQNMSHNVRERTF